MGSESGTHTHNTTTKGAAGGREVVILEPDPLLRALLLRLIQLSGLTARTVSDAEEAAAVCSAGRAAAVVYAPDQLRSKLSGMQWLAREHPRIPVLYTPEEYRSGEAGLFSAVLRKPYYSAELLQLISPAAGRAPLQPDQCTDRP